MMAEQLFFALASSSWNYLFHVFGATLNWLKIDTSYQWRESHCWSIYELMFTVQIKSGSLSNGQILMNSEFGFAGPPVPLSIAEMIGAFHPGTVVSIILSVALAGVLFRNRKLKKVVNERSSNLGTSIGSPGKTTKKGLENMEKANTILNLAMATGKHAPFVWHLDQIQQGRRIYSDRYYELLGYRPQEFELSFKKWETLVHPDDVVEAKRKIIGFLERLTTNNPISELSLKYRIRKKSGDYIWVESKGKVYDERDDLNRRCVVGLITDVTARHEAEIELRNSEEIFKKIFEAETNGMLLVDKEGKIVMQNKRATQIFGYEGDELKELKIENLIPKELRKGHSSLRKEYHKKGKSRIMRDENDFNALTKKGEEIKVQIGLNPVIIKNKKFTLAVVVDMTQRVMMEKALTEKEKLLKHEKDKYEGVFQNLNDGLFIMEVLEEGGFVYREFNKAHQEITGIHQEQAMGRTVEQLFPSQANYLEWRYSACRDSREVITFKDRMEFKNGQRDFQTSLIPIIRNSKVSNIIGITRDITEILESEKQVLVHAEKLKYALDASEDAFIDWDLIEGRVEVSPALNKMLGYEKEEIDSSIEALVELVDPLDVKSTDVDLLLRLTKNLNDEQLSLEFRLRKKDGDWLWVNLRGKIVEREGRKAKRFVGTIADITEDKRKTQEKLETILETEDNERNRIAREIHDGLQQTLTISSINMEFVKKEQDKLTDKAREKLKNGWDYLQKSIHECRAVAHALMPRDIEFGLVISCRNLVNDYNNAIEDISFIFHDNFKGKRIREEVIELTLYRIIQESLNNIIKYAQATEVTIQLKNYDNAIVLSIEDNGKGFNLDKAMKEGSGFGLRSMKNRVDAILGHIEIDTAPNKGTVIMVEIPPNQLELIVTD